MTCLGIARSEVGVAVPRYGISENLKESCKGSDRISRIREAIYENRSGIAQLPEENSQIPEGIRSIPEVKRGLQTRSRKFNEKFFPHTVCVLSHGRTKIPVVH